MRLHRAEVLAFLERLKGSRDRARVEEGERGQWSFRDRQKAPADDPFWNGQSTARLQELLPGRS